MRPYIRGRGFSSDSRSFRGRGGASYPQLFWRIPPTPAAYPISTVNQRATSQQNKREATMAASIMSVFDSWAFANGTTLPLADIKNDGPKTPVIGIEASYYLRRLAEKEPLLTALGGSPLGLEEVIVRDLNDLRSVGVDVFFFFHGLDYGPDDAPFQRSNNTTASNARAFDIYEDGDPVKAITVFRGLVMSDEASLLAWLKIILGKHKIGFCVAPFNAHAQMILALKQGTIDLYHASSEILLFGAKQVLVHMHLKYDPLEPDASGYPQKQFKLGESSLLFLDIDHLAQYCLPNPVPVEVVIDAMFLAGSTQLEIFPPFKDPVRHVGGVQFPEIVNALSRCANDVRNLCQMYPVDPEYYERYMRAVTACRHMIVLFRHDSVKPCTKEKAPSDLHLCIGLRLPDELNYYMFVGLVAPKVMNWLNSGQIKITAPRAGGEDEQYRVLVRDQLQPWRKLALALTKENIHRFYSQKEITTRFWFDSTQSQVFNMRDVSCPKSVLFTFRVRDKQIAGRAKRLKDEHKDCEPRSLQYALRSLADADFAKKSIGSKPPGWNQDLLKSTDEVVCNVVWRVMYLRGLVDDKHQLTAWGNILLTTLDAVGAGKEQTEAAFVAIELIRLGLLSPTKVLEGRHADNIHKRNIFLVATVASIGKLAHRTKGYSGPLNRVLLGYHAKISAVRAALRDLTEMTLAFTFLNGDAKRIRNDDIEVAETLPFQGEFSCGLGVLMKTYLDEYEDRIASVEPRHPEHKPLIVDRTHIYILYAHTELSLKRAFDLWDGVMEGVRASGGLIDQKDKDLWEEVDKWLVERRPEEDMAKDFSNLSL